MVPDEVRSWYTMVIDGEVLDSKRVKYLTKDSVLAKNMSPDHRIEQLDRRIQRPDRQFAARACHDEISTGPRSVPPAKRVEQESRNWKIASEQRDRAGLLGEMGRRVSHRLGVLLRPLSLAMMPGCPCSKAALTRGFLRTGECPRGPVS
jgi:hypothetical protein